MLLHYRVLDMTDEKGWMCGKILSELGADVVKVERPGGDPARNIGPFYHDIPDPEKSLYWFAYNTNKRGITLNIQTSRGQEIFKQLVTGADFVIESFPPGYLSDLGLGYSQLSEINPKIIMTSITPFGQTGPYKDYKGCDLVAMAMGGFMYVCGDADRPPVRISVEQAYPIAGAEAAAGSLIANHCQILTGEGQWVDVSIQECVVRWMFMELCFWDALREVPVRLGPFRRRMATYQRDIWPCKDGHLGFRILGGRLGAETLQALADWMDTENMAGGLKEMDFESLDMSKVTPAESDEWENTLCRFFLKHTKEEIYKKAVEKNMLLCPGYTTKDLVEYEQLRERNFWVDLQYPELGTTIKQPEGFLRASEAKCQIRRRAPLIGEHNEEIYGQELGISEQELALLKEAGVI
jgi:crotonobetainyl-CoA:carnitine CoA-transferase CaiB-like acyl-CoA transferase